MIQNSKESELYMFDVKAVLDLELIELGDEFVDGVKIEQELSTKEIDYIISRYFMCVNMNNETFNRPAGIKLIGFTPSSVKLKADEEFYVNKNTLFSFFKKQAEIRKNGPCIEAINTGKKERFVAVLEFHSA